MVLFPHGSSQYFIARSINTKDTKPPAARNAPNQTTPRIFQVAVIMPFRQGRKRRIEVAVIHVLLPASPQSGIVDRHQGTPPQLPEEKSLPESAHGNGFTKYMAISQPISGD